LFVLFEIFHTDSESNGHMTDNLTSLKVKIDARCIWPLISRQQ